MSFLGQWERTINRRLRFTTNSHSIVVSVDVKETTQGTQIVGHEVPLLLGGRFLQKNEASLV